ncbi:MAG: class I SAM-dependent methyltransferase [Solirubrobacterales bacterium]
MGSGQLFQGVYSADKYQSGNPIARAMVNHFLASVSDFARRTGASRVHEIGCGEGQICGILANQGFTVRGCDLSEASLAVARSEVERSNLNIELKCASIYELDPAIDAEELIICCEVLEHLEEPDKALQKLRQIAKPYLIVSVPNEPLWRILNMARGKYLRDFGNTPDHIQHWSRGAFIRLVEQYADVLAVKNPIPWTVLLCKVR